MKILITTKDGVEIMTVLCPMQLGASLRKWSLIRGKYLGWREINEEDIPLDKTFRDAWHDNGVGIVVDLEKAKIIHAKRTALAAIAASKNAQVDALLASPSIANAKDVGDLISDN